MSAPFTATTAITGASAKASGSRWERRSWRIRLRQARGTLTPPVGAAVVNRDIANSHRSARGRLVGGSSAPADAVGETSADSQVEDDRVAMVDRCRPGGLADLLFIDLEELPTVAIPADLFVGCVPSVDHRGVGVEARLAAWAG